jgi:hypothetical protein
VLDARAYAARYLTHVVGVTGPVAAQYEQGLIINRDLGWVELFTVLAIALIVGVRFRSVVAPIAALACAGPGGADRPLGDVARPPAGPLARPEAARVVGRQSLALRSLATPPRSGDQRPSASCSSRRPETLGNRETPATCDCGRRADTACPCLHLSIGYDHLFISLSAMTTFLSDSPELSLRK